MSDLIVTIVKHKHGYYIPFSWIDVYGYEGEYKINVTTSQIYSLKSQKMIAQAKEKGYYKLHLCKNGKPENFYTHRLLIKSAFPFLDIKKMSVDHVNGIPGDNNIANLQLVEQKENNRRAREKNKGLHNTASRKKVYLFNNLEDYNNNKPAHTFNSTYECVKEMEVHGAALYSSKANKTILKTKLGNFYVKYEEFPDLPGEYWVTSETLIKKMEGDKIEMSNYGRVHDKRTGRKTFGKKHGFYRRYGEKCYFVHYLMIWAFENRELKENEEVCHKDLTPLDKDGCKCNKIENLRIDTHSNNMREHAETYVVFKKRDREGNFIHRELQFQD